MSDNITHEDKERSEALFSRFMSDLQDVASLKPREKFLYPLMHGVPFQDFHVALDIIICANAQQVNDNRAASEVAPKGRDAAFFNEVTDTQDT